jgi:hypothetical protein
MEAKEKNLTFADQDVSTAMGECISDQPDNIQLKTRRYFNARLVYKDGGNTL